MASSALTSVPLSSSSLNVPHSPSKLPSNFLSSPIGAFSRGPTFLFAEPRYHFHPKGNGSKFSIAAQTLDFSDSFFEGGFGSEDDPNSPGGTGFTAVEEKEEPPCPPGLRQYETMMVLRPDMTEDERLALTQKYEEVKFCDFYLVFILKIRCIKIIKLNFIIYAIVRSTICF